MITYNSFTYTFFSNNLRCYSINNETVESKLSWFSTPSTTFTFPGPLNRIKCPIYASYFLADKTLPRRTFIWHEKGNIHQCRVQKKDITKDFFGIFRAVIRPKRLKTLLMTSEFKSDLTQTYIYQIVDGNPLYSCCAMEHS